MSLLQSFKENLETLFDENSSLEEKKKAHAYFKEMIIDEGCDPDGEEANEGGCGCKHNKNETSTTGGVAPTHYPVGYDDTDDKKKNNYTFD